MTKQALLEKIESLPPEKRAQVEEFVQSLVAPRPEGQAPAFSLELFERINAGREALFAEHGLIDTDSILRELRENGGR